MHIAYPNKYVTTIRSNNNKILESGLASCLLFSDPVKSHILRLVKTGTGEIMIQGAAVVQF